MIPTLRNFRQSMVVQAFDDKGHGFPGRYITVNLNAESHPDILAACISMRGNNNQIETCIAVDRSLATLPRYTQKECLAHEWIHAMMSFRSETKNVIEERRLSDQSEGALYGYWLTANSFWQDDESFSQKLKVALSQLLVPDELILHTLYEDFQINMKQIQNAFNTTDNIVKLIDIAKDFAKIFSARYSVSSEIVTKRLVEIIGF